jgi:hypothetical protein
MKIASVIVSMQLNRYPNGIYWKKIPKSLAVPV